jgi:uncharacterized membrane protein YkoI
MKSNTALTISAILTAFVLVVIGGVVVTAYAAEQNNNSQTLASAPQATSSDQQASIAQAGQQLQQADNNQQVANPAAPQLPVDAAIALATARSVAVSDAVPKGAPQLVSFEGNTAYEVSFEQGMIYVDANTGQVLFNGTQPQSAPQIDAQQAAQIAANYLGEGDVLDIQLVNFNGATVYQVSFFSGNVVFVTPTGQVAYVQMAASANSGGAGGGGSFGPSYSGGEHEGSGDHEGGD